MSFRSRQLSWGLDLHFSCFVIDIRSCAHPYHRVEWVREEAAWAAVEAADVAEVFSLLEVVLNELHVSLIVQFAPDSDCLSWEATVREGNNYRRPYSQDSSDLAQYGHGVRQLVYGDADSCSIELCLTKRQLRRPI